MFDPAQPANNSALSSAVMRSQLTSLKALIDAIISIIAAQVDGVVTLNPGDPAFVTLTVDGNLMRFSFGIPKGNDGTPGQPGSDGTQGQQGIPGTDGQQGAQGPPFAQAIVDAVNTLLPGESAWVTVSFDGTNVHLTFGIPRGAEGVQGPPGEVTNAQLAAEIATTARNPINVQPLSIAFSDPPTSGELNQVQDKINEILTEVIRLP